MDEKTGKLEGGGYYNRWIPFGKGEEFGLRDRCAAQPEAEGEADTDGGDGETDADGEADADGGDGEACADGGDGEEKVGEETSIQKEKRNVECDVCKRSLIGDNLNDSKTSRHNNPCVINVGRFIEMRYLKTSKKVVEFLK